MAVDKDPSIYTDRGTIGSSDELDEYGVWVKSEPQDISSADDGGDLSMEPSLPDLEDLPDLNLGSDDADEPDIPSFDSLPPLDTDGLSVKSLPEDSTFDDGFTELSMDDFLDDDPETSLSDSLEKGIEEEALDIDLDFTESSGSPMEDLEESSPSPRSASESEDTIQFEPVSEFDDFLDTLSEGSGSSSEAAVTKIPPKASEGEAESDGVSLSAAGGSAERADEAPFDDMAALGRDMADDAPPARTSAAAQRPLDLSTQLLMRIADELSSIKTEISSLKNELSILRETPKLVQTEPDANDEDAHGFFDEEDDETIALTGDELDNILNTADFTEEAGSDATEDRESELIIPDMDMEETPLSDREDLLMDEDRLPLPEEEAAPLADDDELKVLIENGVQPMTEAPEDTSYLEAEPISMDAVDLSDAVIDEPDLGDFNLEETEIEEPAIESIAMDLDMEESLHMEDSGESADVLGDIGAAGGDGIEEIELSVDDPSFGDSEVVEIQSIDDEPVSSLDLSGIENAPEQEESFEEILPEGFLVESEDELEGQEFSPPVFEADEMVIEAEELSFTEEMPGDIREDAIRAPAIQAAQPKQAEVRPSRTGDGLELPSNLKMEVKAVLSYMDQLLESLPEEKIEEFAKSEYFESYKKLFEELGLV